MRFHIHYTIYHIGSVSAPWQRPMVFFIMQIKRFTVVDFELFEYFFIFN